MRECALFVFGVPYSFFRSHFSLPLGCIFVRKVIKSLYHSIYLICKFVIKFMELPFFVCCISFSLSVMFILYVLLFNFRLLFLAFILVSLF